MTCRYIEILRPKVRSFRVATHIDTITSASSYEKLFTIQILWKGTTAVHMYCMCMYIFIGYTYYTIDLYETNLISLPPSLFSPRLCIHLILHAEFEAAIGVLAVVCSSWVPVNRGSTGRSLMTPLGNENFISVRKGNKLTSRSSSVQKVFKPQIC